jgi:hypothetical protein
MRAKAAKSEKKASGAAVRLGGGRGSSKERDRNGGAASSSVGTEKPLKILQESRTQDAGFGVAGIGKAWSVQAGVQSQAKDRGVAPPALPVPIASFTI